MVGASMSAQMATLHDKRVYMDFVIHWMPQIPQLLVTPFLNLNMKMVLAYQVAPTHT
jgi:hypothetical protein